MTFDKTNTEIDLHLEKLANKIDEHHVETQKELVELKILMATVSAQYAERFMAHGKELNDHSRRVSRLEDRTWQAAGGIALGLIGTLASIAVAVLTLT